MLAFCGEGLGELVGGSEVEGLGVGVGEGESVGAGPVADVVFGEGWPDFQELGDGDTDGGVGDGLEDVLVGCSHSVHVGVGVWVGVAAWAFEGAFCAVTGLCLGDGFCAAWFGAWADGAWRVAGEGGNTGVQDCGVVGEGVPVGESLGESGGVVCEGVEWVAGVVEVGEGSPGGGPAGDVGGRADRVGALVFGVDGMGDEGGKIAGSACCVDDCSDVAGGGVCGERGWGEHVVPVADVTELLGDAFRVCHFCSRCCWSSSGVSVRVVMGYSHPSDMRSLGRAQGVRVVARFVLLRAMIRAYTRYGMGSLCAG